MPNKQGFDELVERGNIQLHCIWCNWRPERISVAQQAAHARKHRKDAEAAAEASKREQTMSQVAIAV